MSLQGVVSAQLVDNRECNGSKFRWAAARSGDGGTGLWGYRCIAQLIGSGVHKIICFVASSSGGELGE